jgi:hypothetical protein
MSKWRAGSKEDKDDAGEETEISGSPSLRFEPQTKGELGKTYLDWQG